MFIFNCLDNDNDEAKMEEINEPISYRKKGIKSHTLEYSKANVQKSHW